MRIGSASINYAFVRRSSRRHLNINNHKLSRWHTLSWSPQMLSRAWSIWLTPPIVAAICRCGLPAARGSWQTCRVTGRYSVTVTAVTCVPRDNGRHALNNHTVTVTTMYMQWAAAVSVLDCGVDEIWTNLQIRKK